MQLDLYVCSDTSSLKSDHAYLLFNLWDKRSKLFPK